MFSGEARDCLWSEWGAGAGPNPECEAWVLSGCDPDLAGREPAVTASIVDVADLADDNATRVFEWRARDGYDYGGVVVQLWTAQCTEIPGSKWRSRNPAFYSNIVQQHERNFLLPPETGWMTVTTNDPVNLEWTLT